MKRDTLSKKNVNCIEKMRIHVFIQRLESKNKNTALEDRDYDHLKYGYGYLFYSFG